MHLHFRTVCGKLKKQATHERQRGRATKLHMYLQMRLYVCSVLCVEEDDGASAKPLLAFVKMLKNKNSKKKKKKETVNKLELK